MNKQIEELQALWRKIAEVLLKDPHNDKIRIAFRQALEAALGQPQAVPASNGEPVGYSVQTPEDAANNRITPSVVFDSREEIESYLTGSDTAKHIVSLYTAAPPAKTPMQKVAVPPPGVDMQEVMYACGWNDACEKFGNPVYEPTPPVVIEVTRYTDTPPPRLTNKELEVITGEGDIRDCYSGDVANWRAIETAVRKQFGYD